MESINNDMVSTCCGKILLGYRQDRCEEAGGVVIWMRRLRWEVRLQGSNEVITIIPSKINKNTGEYDIVIKDGNNTFQMIEYAPVRVKLLC